METFLTILGIGAAAVLLFYGLRWFQAPRKNTQHLVMTVWAAYGPYSTAENAEDVLRTAVRIILGSEGKKENEEWVQGHVGNFHEWEKEGRFESGENLMRKGLLLTAYGSAFNEAFEKIRAEYITQAQEAAENLNKDLLEEGGHRIEKVMGPDGNVDFAFKKIWSDEEIEQKKKEDGEAILNAIGNNLLQDQSDEGKELVEFLRIVYRQNTDDADRELKTAQELGQVWTACLTVSIEDPSSEVTKIFRVLNEAWRPPGAE